MLGFLSLSLKKKETQKQD